MIQLFNDQVLLKHLPVQESSRIHTPDAWDTEIGRTSLRGLVVDVGPGRVLPNGKRQAMTVQPGDVVLFYGLEEMTWPERVGSVSTRLAFDKDHVIIRERHIQAVLDQARAAFHWNRDS